MPNARDITKGLEKRRHRGARVQSLRIMTADDENPDVSWLDQSSEELGGDEAGKKDRKLNQERLESFHRGDWHMRGLWVEADVIVGGTVQKIRSGGLWGIESDANREYLQSVAEEEYDALKSILREMGVRHMPPFSKAEWSEGR
jgi:hypothetical protein